jgi:hypothetical protein
MGLDTPATNSSAPADFVTGLYDTAVRQPVDGVRQLFGAHVQEQDQSNRSLAYKAGGIAGFILDFTALSRVTGGAADRLMGESSTGLFASETAKSASKMSLAGGIYGGVLTPSSESKSLVEGRLEGAAVTGATFATMGGIAKKLEEAKVLGANQLVNRVGNNAIAGGAGGIVGTIGNTCFTEHRMATPAEIASGAGQYALFGAGFGALDFGIQKVSNNSAVQEKYYELKWSLGDTAKDAKRKAYGLLNDYDLRHPVARLGDAITDSKSILENQPRPTLTAENNPVAAIERELPKFYESIDQSEAKYDQVQDHQQRRAIYHEQNELKVQFGEKLLKWWHGTETEPGLKQFSDQELSTLTLPADRVAQIRKVLATQGREISEPLADLGGRERRDVDDISGGIEMAKERFFGYDERALSEKMAMPREHFIKDRDGLAPLSWMPFEPTAKLTNLFHGTVSSSLPGVFEEGGMLPSYELRLRGITHAGESANQEFPKRSISLTRDFSEAWAYHRPSPLSLDTYPVVFGISADVTPRMRQAGFSEPGEQLIDRLKLGSSWLTKVGLRSPEITHIYVPDSQISSVNRMLEAYRVKGVSVVGVDQIPQPDWTATPQFNSEEEADNWLRSP